MRCHSCAQCDLFTRLSPDDGDDKLSVMASLLRYWVLYWRVMTTGCSLRGAVWLRRRSFCGRTLPLLNRGISVGCAS